MKNRLKELRTSKGLSMREAAKQLELPPTTYCNWENGEREPNSEMMVRLADFYGVSIDYMIGRTDEREVKAQTFVTRSEDELLSLFRSMNEEQKGLILSTAKAIKK